MCVSVNLILSPRGVPGGENEPPACVPDRSASSGAQGVAAGFGAPVALTLDRGLVILTGAPVLFLARLVGDHDRRLLPRTSR